LIAFRAKSTAGLNGYLSQLKTLFQYSGISTNSIVDFLSDGAKQGNDLFSLLHNSTDLDALIESRVQEILTNSGEPSEVSLLNFNTTI
jgi:hypothetical protein